MFQKVFADADGVLHGLLTDITELWYAIVFRNMKQTGDPQYGACIFSDPAFNFCQIGMEATLCMLVNVLSGYPVYIDKMLPDLKRLYTDTMTVFALRHLIDGNFLEAQRVYDGVDVPEEENVIRRWFGSGKLGQQKLCAEIISKLPKLSMELVFDDKTQQIRMEPVVNSAIDAAYFALSRFAAVNAGALDDYGGKTNIAFCQACGRAFIKRGNRQKYCGTMQCQSIRNNRKSSDYYYRKKKEEQENS